MNERNLNEGQWEDRKQWSLGVGQRRKTIWNRYILLFIVVSSCTKLAYVFAWFTASLPLGKISFACIWIPAVVLTSRDAEESVRIHPKYVLKEKQCDYGQIFIVYFLIMFTAKLTMLECCDSVRCEQSAKSHIREFTLNWAWKIPQRIEQTSGQHAVRYTTLCPPRRHGKCWKVFKPLP